MRVYILLFLSVFLTSCIVNPRYEGDDRGYLVFSLVAAKNTNYGSYVLQYLDADGNRGNVTYLQNNMFGGSERDYDNDDYNGIVEMHSLPSGSYELVNYVVKSSGDMISWSPREKFSYRFDVNPGNITYLGQFMAHMTKGRNRMGLSILTGAVFSVHNNQESDIEIAHSKYVIESTKVSNFVPNVRFLGE